MLFAEEIRGIVKTILSQDELLSFERVLESAPEVYDYSGVMTDEQLNHLIAFLSRNKENIFLELKHVKEERDEQYASTFPHCSMKSSEYLWPKTKRLVKDERRSKSKLRVCA